MKPTLDELRQFYLSDIHELRSYRPGKNSFVEGPDRRLGCYRAPGQRLTLLDVAGFGSVRHLWSTWREGQGNHRLEFFADGAKKPGLAGTLDELIAAAQHSPSPPVTGFVGNKGARNLFLPVPFKRHMRIEMETLEPTWLIFYQIDYRTGQKGDTPHAAGKMPALQHTQHSVTIPANARADIATLTGPGIARRWRLKTDVNISAHNLLRLETRYDGAVIPAVRSNLADFFGP
ncbi:MAG: hypothetical protein NTY01_10615, partial [Verrucomicrobia bacterium]|nr:hypothetical protein [Verrucomicrobiota bacterium]